MSTAHPLASVAKRRDRVGQEITRTASATGLDAARTAEAVLRILPAGCDLTALYHSILPLHGQPPDPVKIREVAWAIAGNLKALKVGKVVYPPSVKQDPETAVLQVLAAARVPKVNRPGAPQKDPKTRYRFRVVQGATCPLIFESVWSDKYVRYLASHPTGFGFAKPPRGTEPSTGRPFQHPDTLVGFLFRAKIAAGKDNNPTLTSVTCTGGQRDYNRAVTALRWRDGGFKCPFNYTIRCFECPKGQNSCPAACRPKDMNPVSCPVCHQDGFTDPNWPATGVCTRCTAKGRRITLKMSKPTCHSQDSQNH